MPPPSSCEARAPAAHLHKAGPAPLPHHVLRHLPQGGPLGDSGGPLGEQPGVLPDGHPGVPGVLADGRSTPGFRDRRGRIITQSEGHSTGPGLALAGVATTLSPPDPLGICEINTQNKRKRKQQK